MLGELTLEEKVGQLLLPRAPASFRNRRDPERRAIVALAESGRIGGAVVFAGTSRGHPGDDFAPPGGGAAAAADRGGLRVGSGDAHRGGRPLSPGDAVGAAPDAAALERQGAIIAGEARAVGVQLVLAPVLDVLQTPEAAVIGTRSFGADPDVAAELGAAFVRGLQRGGVLATAKHFPGHGGTETDSHHRLATIAGSREHLDRVDLVPFRAAVEAGVAAVMPGHLAVPALDGRADRPATLSPEILGGLLREELGFSGLVVSDALEMEGARAGRFDGEVAASAVAAGVDVILVPTDPVVAHASLVRAVRAGRLPEARLDAAVSRVLTAKARLGLFGDRRPPGALADSFSDPGARAWAESLFSRGLVLVRDPEELLPFSTGIGGAGEPPPRLLLVEIHREGPHEPDRRALRGELRRRGALRRRIPVTAAGRCRSPASPGRRMRRTWWCWPTTGGTAPAPPEELVTALTPFAEKLVAVSFGNPNGVRGLPPEAAVLLAWDGAAAASARPQRHSSARGRSGDACRCRWRGSRSAKGCRFRP